VRYLINQHGKEGVWLWDPYLSAEDVVSTLLYYRFYGSELRALTSGNIPPTEKQPMRRKQPRFGTLREKLRVRFARREAPASISARFAAKQRATFTGIKSNWRGVRLEFRVRTGRAGWAFHDRFLIFPGADRAALAWSLGTSINSLGRQHHILQRDHRQIRSGSVTRRRAQSAVSSPRSLPACWTLRPGVGSTCSNASAETGIGFRRRFRVPSLSRPSALGSFSRVIATN
jgi:hypothetical protein